MKQTLRYALEVEVEVDGKHPGDDVVNERMVEAMNDGFPSVVFDDEELDCAVLVNSWCYELVDGKPDGES